MRSGCIVFFFIALFHMRKRICLRSNAQICIVHMSIDLSGIKVIVAENFLKRAYINTILQH